MEHTKFTDVAAWLDDGVDGQTLMDPFRWVAFWLAVVLPILYGPGLILYGLGELSMASFGGLLGVHGVALLVGHRHRSSTEGSGADESIANTTGRVG